MKILSCHSLSNYLMTTLCLIFLFSGDYYFLQAQDASETFEGIIEYRYHTYSPEKGRESNAFTYMAKGHMSRVEFISEYRQKTSILIDTKARRITMLMDQAKAYMEIPISSQPDSSHSRDKQTKIQKTEKKMTVAGHKCEIWRVDHKGEQVDLCVASGMGKIMLPGTRLPGRVGTVNVNKKPEWIKEILQEGFIPLKVDISDNGSAQTVLKATSINPKNLQASLFTIPDGYQDMSRMMHRMMQQNGNN